MVFKPHERCDDQIHYLRSKLDEATERIHELENEILVEQNRPTMTVGPPRVAQVYYMDDARLVELEEGGDAPT